MLNLLKKRKHVYYLFLFLLNIILEESNYITFPLSTFIKEEDFKPLFIVDNSADSKFCQFWVPSLLYPTLLVFQTYDIE
jgi:hypothetical protein